MRAVSLRRQGEAYKRAKAEAALGRVDGCGVCAHCGLYGKVAGHERRSRSQGGDPTKPDCLACNFCNGNFEDEPIWAAWNGWKISRKHPRDPDLAPNEARRFDGAIHTFAEAMAS